MWFVWVVVILTAYLIGSIPTAYLLVKMKLGVDIRDVGSGNMGTTNSVRTAGWFTGVCVFIIDGLKGFIPAYASFLIGGSTMAATASIAAALGHLYPLFLGFRGGKGVAVTLGIALALVPFVGITAFISWCLLLLVIGYVSVASCSAVVVATLVCLFASQPWQYTLMFAVLSALIIIKHSSNFRQLKSGEEHRCKFTIKWGRRK